MYCDWGGCKRSGGTYFGVNGFAGYSEAVPITRDQARVLFEMEKVGGLSAKFDYVNDGIKKVNLNNQYEDVHVDYLIRAKAICFYDLHGRAVSLCVDFPKVKNTQTTDKNSPVSNSLDKKLGNTKVK